MSKLDKARSYGEVSGTGVDHRYEQDGKKFDGMGNEIHDTILEPVPPLTKPTPKRKGTKK